MRTKIASKKTAEQRQAEAKVLQDGIAAQVETLRSSEEWVKWLEFTSSFHNYSLNNVFNIQLQRPGATQVAGFRAWQDKGRQVRKGEKSIKIFGYSVKKITEVKDGVETEKAIPRFPILSVFDISQTDLAEGAEDVQSPVQHLSGDDEHGVVDAVASYLATIGWTLVREAIPGSANGYSTTGGDKRVVVDSGLSPAQAAKTALHEAAHVTLGHCEAADGEYVAHRGAFETEAESVAYVLAGLLGLDSSAYSIGYVAGWSGGDASVIRESANKVLHAVHTLAGELLEAEESAQAA